MPRIVTEPEFRIRLQEKLKPLKGVYRSVTGPGRSGAIAAVYASHYLGIPFVPCRLPSNAKLLPVLIVDTAVESGRTLRKASHKCGGVDALAIYQEPPRVKFWYEV